MSDCVSPPLAALLAFTAVAPLIIAGCSSDPVKSTCAVEYAEITVPHQPGPKATPLMLLPDARLDSVGDGFVLLGTDGTTVRWLVLGLDGVATGAEQSITVPPHAAGPWFAVAGLNAPKDHLVVAYLPAEVSGTTSVGERALMTLSVPIDNPAAVAVPAAAGFIAAGAEVSMISGRAGRHAALAWAQAGQSTISARLLGGDGLPVADDLILGAVQDSIRGCLRFSAGKGDFSVGYIDTSNSADPLFVGTEIGEDGASGNTLRLKIGPQVMAREVPDCVDLVSSDTGYGLAWHSPGLDGGGVGTYFGTYDPTRPGFPSAQVLSDVRVEGTVPVEAGLGWLGKQYAVVFARPSSAEIWPIDAMGRRQGVLPPLPSVAGHIGKLSSQPVGRVLYATYADYLRDNDFTAGSRLLVKVSCP